MGLTVLEQRAPNFAEAKKWRCLNCGKGIEVVGDIYSRRFCCVECKDQYFSPLKTV